MNFSDKIKFQREQNHLTQKELAELVGVSQRAIAAYESSGTIARISTMRKLAHALNVSYDYLKHDEITDPSYGIEKICCLALLGKLLFNTCYRPLVYRSFRICRLGCLCFLWKR